MEDEDIEWWGLVMNPITGKAEAEILLMTSTNPKKLEEFMESQKETWVDDSREVSDDYGNMRIWNKSFKKGSFLEWMQVPFRDPIRNLGSIKQHIAQARAMFERNVIQRKI